MPEKLRRCPNGTRRNKKTGECEPTKVPQPKSGKLRRCPNGTRRNKKTGECEPTKVHQPPLPTQPIQPTEPKPGKLRRCPNGTRRNKKTGECEPTKAPKVNNKPKPKSATPKKSIPKKFKIKSALRPIIHKVVKANNLEKIDQMNKKYDGESGLKFVEDYCGYQAFVMYKWLMNKYKKIMNTHVYSIEVFLKKDGKIVDYSKMKKCLTTRNRFCFKRGLVNFAKYANHAKRTGKKYYISPLSLSYSGKKIGHQNALIYDIRKNKMYRFEPHGWDTSASSSALDTYLANKIKESYTRFGIKNEMPEYVLRLDSVMPRFGPQTFDRSPGKGRCVIWTQAFLHYRLQYNNLSEAQIFRFLGLKKYTGMKDLTKEKITLIEKDVARFIKTYTKYLQTQKPVMDLYDTKRFRDWMSHQLAPLV